MMHEPPVCALRGPLAALGHRPCVARSADGSALSGTRGAAPTSSSATGHARSTTHEPPRAGHCNCHGGRTLLFTQRQGVQALTSWRRCRAGADDYLVKPVDDELEARMWWAVERVVRMHRELAERNAQPGHHSQASFRAVCLVWGFMHVHNGLRLGEDLRVLQAEVSR